MGVVCSCFASTFVMIGELASTLFLAVGQVAAVLVRGIFAVLVGLCDVMAACACCCRVPFDQRPDRDGYTYATLATTTPVSIMPQAEEASKTTSASPRRFKVAPLFVKRASTANKESTSSQNEKASLAQASKKSVDSQRTQSADSPGPRKGWFRITSAA